MAEIVPTILAKTLEEYAERLELVTKTAKRVHVDIVDGQFARNKTIGLAQVYVPEGVTLDLHLMVQKPHDYLSSALALKPNLIIVHAEADGDHTECAADITAMGVKAGIAYLQATQPDESVADFNHALVFTGTLGENHGAFHAEALNKLETIKNLKPGIETSVDGGVTPVVARQIQADILYVGGAYEELVS